jgi:putative methylase
VKRRALAQRLTDVEGFREPRLDLEQYPTPPEVAASLLHRAALDGDLDRRVVDLGSGTGRLAIGAALLGARAVGIERDPQAIGRARTNARRVVEPADRRPAWVAGDVTRPPVDLSGTTVVANPPFGAQNDSQGDRGFLRAASGAAVSWTLHNAGSRDFVGSVAADHGGRVTATFRVRIGLDRQFEFHTDASREIDAIAVRIRWADAADNVDV